MVDDKDDATDGELEGLAPADSDDVGDKLDEGVLEPEGVTLPVGVPDADAVIDVVGVEVMDKEEVVEAVGCA